MSWFGFLGVLLRAVAAVVAAPRLKSLERPARDLDTLCRWSALRGVVMEMPRTRLTRTLLRIPWRELRYRLFILPYSVLFVLHAARVVVRVKGPALLRARGLGLLEQWCQVVSLCLANPGRLVPEDYYVFALHNPDNEPFARLSAQNFHLRGLIDLGAVAAGQADRPRFMATLTDKERFLSFCAEHGLPAPAAVAVFAEGRARWLGEPSGRLPHEDLFVKPVVGAVGAGASRLLYDPEGDSFRLESTPMSEDEVLRHLEAASLDTALLVQRRLANHPQLVPLVGDRTLSTLRVFTARVLPDEYAPVAAFLRLGQGDGPVDNFSSGGLACIVDLESGRLGPGYRKYGEDRHLTHPRTGARLADVAVPGMDRVVELCLRAHRVLVEADGGFRLPVVGWDVAVTAEGPLLVEANSPCDLILQKGLDEPLLAHPVFSACLESHLARYRELLGQ